MPVGVFGVGLGMGQKYELTWDDALSLVRILDENWSGEGKRCEAEAERFRGTMRERRGREPTPAEYYAAGEVSSLKANGNRWRSGWNRS